MTLHSAKGLEFPWVFICGMEEGLLPHSRSLIEPAELEEERRLFYVGCTRAMDRLYLLHAKNRMLYGESQYVIPSQFLEDIPKELMEHSGGLNMPNMPLRSRLGGGNVGGRGNFFRKQGGMGKGNMGKKPIPFEKPLQEFTDGDRVMHGIFGEGIVVNASPGIITVAFKDPKI